MLSSLEGCPYMQPTPKELGALLPFLRMGICIDYLVFCMRLVKSTPFIYLQNSLFISVCTHGYWFYGLGCNLTLPSVFCCPDFPSSGHRSTFRRLLPPDGPHHCCPLVLSLLQALTPPMSPVSLGSLCSVCIEEMVLETKIWVPDLITASRVSGLQTLSADKAREHTCSYELLKTKS